MPGRLLPSTQQKQETLSGSQGWEGGSGKLSRTMLSGKLKLQMRSDAATRLQLSASAICTASLYLSKKRTESCNKSVIGLSPIITCLPPEVTHILNQRCFLESMQASACSTAS